METKRKRGRPKIDNPKKEWFQMRLTKEDRKLLDEIKSVTGKTKSQIIRDSLRNYIRATEGDSDE